MRVLITTFTFPPDSNGVALVSYNHAILLHQLGYEVYIATSNNMERKVEAYPFKIFEFNVSGNANIRNRYKGEIKKYIDFISTIKCEIIICHAYQIWSTDLALRAFKNNPAKKVMISHGISANSRRGFPRTILAWLLWRPYIWRMPKMMDSFDHLIFLSDKQDKDRFYDFYLLNKRKKTNYSIIPNGVDFLGDVQESNSFNSFRRKYNIPEDTFLILNVSNYSSDKNQFFVLKSFLGAEIKNAVLVFIGSNKNSYSKSLEDFYFNTKRKYEPEKNVHFLSSLSRNDIINAYKAADLFCFASKTEYFPLVIIEAMISKTAWISTDVGCVANLPGGIVVKSIIEMTENIIKLSQNREILMSYSLAGYDHAKNNFLWSIIGEKLNIILKDLADD